MNFKKEVIGRLDTCYSVSDITINGEKKLLFATESTGACYSYDLETKEKETVWTAPGGTLSMYPIPGKNGDFLAIQDFTPVYRAKEAKLVWVKVIPGRYGNTFSVKKILDIPYIHRFCIIAREKKNFLITATLCRGKEFTDDWSMPGEILVGELPDKPATPHMISLFSGLTKNHGLWSGTLDGKETVLVSSDEGVFAVDPPHSPENQWSIRYLIKESAGDIAVSDIDGDGQDEIVAIENFHGDNLKIYHKDKDLYKTMWECPEKTEFGHALWGGRLSGKPCFICGHRSGKQKLFTINYVNGEFMLHTIDEGNGPSNVHVFQHKGREGILTANREANESVIYWVEDTP